MNQSQPRHRRWRYWAMGLAVFLAIALIYMLLASLFMGVADLLGYWLPRKGSIKGTAASSVLPAIAIAIAVTT